MPSRLDLPAVEHALHALQRQLLQPNGHEPLSEEIVTNLIEGYRRVDWLVAHGQQPFQRGGSREWLNLNSIVLCGRPLERAQEWAEHLRATEEHFYDDESGGIRNVMEWYSRERQRSPLQIAAGTLLHIGSAPQLFLEGNHRTAPLIASWTLLLAGRPPLLISSAHAVRYFALMERVRRIERRSSWSLIRRLRLMRRLRCLVRAATNPKLLVAQG